MSSTVITPQPITVTNELPAVFEVVPAKIVARFTDLIAQSGAFGDVTEANLHEADALLRGIHDTHKEVEAIRKELKAPVLQAGKLIDECAKNALLPLDAAKKALQTSIASYNAKVRAEAERLRKEAEAKARAEHEAAVAKAKAEHEAAVAAAQAEAEKKRAEHEAAAAEAAALFGDEIPAPVLVSEPEPELVVPTYVAPIVTRPTMSAAVKTRKVTKLNIFDPKAIAALYEINGAVLVTVDEKTVRKLLEAGIKVIGAELVTEEIPVMGR